MNGSINIYDLIYIDIETVPQQPSYHNLSHTMQDLWAHKHATLKPGDETPEEGYLNRAGIYAEFGKIICISIGYFRTDKVAGKRIFRVKSFYGDDEKELLKDFSELINKNFSPERYHFCGHNIREFDIPFICRRMLIQWLPIPAILNMQGKKPWEVQDIDTMQLWKFGDYKSYTSLKLLAEVMGIPTPKSDIEGKDVCAVYWQQHNLVRIAEYCNRDVVTVARLLLRMQADPELLEDNEVVTVTA
jgi:DNA polymerase elongation subunit (family B)